MGQDTRRDLRGSRRVIALETNILVAAHRGDHPHHAKADAALRELCTAGTAWSLPWPCAHEFLDIVTHPRIWLSTTPAAQALDALGRWLRLSFVQTLAE